MHKNYQSQHILEKKWLCYVPFIFLIFDGRGHHRNSFIKPLLSYTFNFLEREYCHWIPPSAPAPPPPLNLKKDPVNCKAPDW